MFACAGVTQISVSTMMLQKSIHPSSVLAFSCTQGCGVLLEPIPTVIRQRQRDTLDNDDGKVSKGKLHHPFTDQNPTYINNESAAAGL